MIEHDAHRLDSEYMMAFLGSKMKIQLPPLLLSQLLFTLYQDHRDVLIIQKVQEIFIALRKITMEFLRIWESPFRSEKTLSGLSQTPELYLVMGFNPIDKCTQLSKFPEAVRPPQYFNQSANRRGVASD